MALFMAEMGGAIFLYALPRFKAGEFGGTFSVPASSLPQPGSAPLANQEGRFWLCNTKDGVYAIYKVCTHLGCTVRAEALSNPETKVVEGSPGGDRLFAWTVVPRTGFTTCSSGLQARTGGSADPPYVGCETGCSLFQPLESHPCLTSQRPA
jgi:Rieske Fe-S protein